MENRSGVGIEVAIKRGATSLNGCSNEGVSRGLPLIDEQNTNPYNKPQFTYFPPNGKIVATVTFGSCHGEAFKGVKSTDVGTSLVIRQNGTMFVLPLSTSNVPINFGGFI